MKNMYQIDQNGQSEPKLTKVARNQSAKWAKMNTVNQNRPK